MGQTLDNGIYLPSEGERNCYSGLAENWVALDTLVGAYSSHYQNTTIHVTASDKQTWNGKQDALSQTQLDAVNSGIDSSKVQQIATNTSDISSLQSGKANNSDVVHKSGNETVGGDKKFTGKLSSNNYYYGSIPWGLDKANVWSESQTVSGNSKGWIVTNPDIQKGVVPSSNKNGYIWFNENGGTYLGRINSVVTPEGRTSLWLSAVNYFKNGALDPNGSNITTSLMLRVESDGKKETVVTSKFCPDSDHAFDLGTSAKRWKTLNGINPGALSLPSGNLNDIIDISSYLTDLTGSNANTYIAPANGWISITMSNSAGIQAYINGLWGHQVVRPSAGRIRFLMPILKDKTANILIFGGTIDNAYFIPCRGNV